MFIAVYEFTVKPGRGDDFRAAWLKLTQGIYHRAGSLGSRLHATDNALVFVGYAQWPDRAAWAAPRAVDDAEYAAARRAMDDSLERSRTLHELVVTDDYLQRRPFTV